jgi:hypothetical protein
MTTNQETHMTTQISTKLAALAVALMMNTLIIGGVGYLFNSQAQQHAAVTSLAHTTVSTSHEAA